MHVERLSKFDAIFYFTDSDRVPMQANVAILVDGPVDYTAYVAWLRDRMDSLPRMVCRLEPAPWNLRLPAWTPMASFSLDDHVAHHTLSEPGDDSEFKTLLTELIHRRITLDGPLWRLDIVTGLAGGRSALVLRWHHCMADAEGTLAILNVLLETQSPGEVMSSRMSRFGQTRQDAAPPHVGAWRWPGVRDGWRKVLIAARYARARGPDLPFFAPVSGRVTIAWRQFDVAGVRAIARTANATVSDVILAALGSAVDRYAREHGIAVHGACLRVQVPANVRRANKYGELGNELAMLPGLVPLGISDPYERLRRVAAYNRMLKDVGMAAAMRNTMGALFAMLTPFGQALVCRLLVSRTYLKIARRFGLMPHEHALMTSIVLPAAQYAVQGRPVTAMLNFVACQFNMGFVVSPVTYDDVVTLTLSADATNLGDAEIMLDYAMDGINELMSSAEAS